MQIKIHNLEGCELLDYRQIKPLQDTEEGSLKDLHEKEYTKLKNSLIKHGYTFPGFVWKKSNDDYYAIDMHQRLQVMTKEDMNDNGSYKIPVVFIPAKDEKEAKEKLLLATSQYGKITQEGLDAYIAQAELPEAEIYEAISFDALPLLGVTEEPEVEEDEPPEVDEGGAALSVLGTVYQLGPHRLLCGDALNMQNVELLMSGVKADIVVTDPPYNTGMTEASQGADTLKRGSTRLTHMFDDSFTDEEWQEFMSTFVSTYYMIMKENSVAYIFLDWRRNHELIPHIKDHFQLSNIIVWDKVVHGLGSDYKYTYEVLNVCKKGKPELNTHQGEAEYSDVWHIQRKVGRDEDHATKKPVELFARAMRHASKEGDIVVDLFMGSGTCIVAAEQLNRVCYGAELEPKYVDLCRKRYAKLMNNNELPDNWEELTPAIGD